MTRTKTLLVAETVLLAIGFLCLAWAGYMSARGIASNSWQSYKFEQSLAGEDPSVKGFMQYLWRGGEKTIPHAEGEQPAIEDGTPPPSTARRKYARGEVIGKIEIPRIKVSAVVKQGSDTKTLSRAAGHVSYTALPGEKGNIGLAAHRDTHFRGLRNVRHGDVIRVTTHDGTYLYEVDALKIVWPKNVDVLNPTPDPRLTLVTCYPFNYVGSAPKRFIVQAKQVGFEDLSARVKNPDQPGPAARTAKAGS